MKRTLVLLVLVLLLSAVARATTYYVAASGSDSNNGTSETTPWMHAPGMPNCTGTCASVTPNPGDSFIFRGGDTWHAGNSSASPYIGTASCGSNTCGWTWTWSGSSSSCNYEGSALGNNGPTSSCIYIGVDKTWYSGAVFARPIINGDNPTSTSIVSSCTYPFDNGPRFIQIGNQGAGTNSTSYVILDNFEFMGNCWDTGSGQGPASAIGRYGTYIDIINSYFHGWTRTSSGLDNAPEIGGYSPTVLSHNIEDYDVFDGSDSYCITVDQCSGDAISTDAYMVEHCIFRWIAAGISGESNQVAVHDNLFEHLYETSDGVTHGDIDFMYGNSLPSSDPTYFYNNTVRNSEMGQGIALTRSTGTGSAVYVFNNVFFGIVNACLTFYSTDTTAGAYYVTNNTFDYPCSIGSDGSGNPQDPNGVMYFQNDHMIGFGCTGPVSSSCGASLDGAPLTVTDNGDEIFQTESVANGQGYTTSNNYQPASTSGATYHAGGDLASSCSTYSADSALCSGSTGGYTNTAGSGTIPAALVSPQPSRGSTWDAGAYQYAAGSGPVPAPAAGMFVQNGNQGIVKGQMQP